MSSRGVSSSKRITASIIIKEESSVMRAVSLFTGRLGAFCKRFTEASVFTATIRKSPSSAALLKDSICPACKISKQPLVNTMDLPLKRWRLISACSSLRLLYIFRADACTCFRFFRFSFVNNRNEYKRYNSSQYNYAGGNAPHDPPERYAYAHRNAVQS